MLLTAFKPVVVNWCLSDIVKVICMFAFVNNGIWIKITKSKEKGMQFLNW